MGMIKSPRKMWFLGLLVGVGIFFAHITTVNAADKPELAPTQPVALNHIGVYGLRQMEPALTGMGVKIALVSRSLTYVDGEPLNDCRPFVSHNCFAGKKFTFFDQGDKPAGISPHSTSECSILFGRDPYGFDEQLRQFRYEGVVPDAEADIYEFWYFLTNNIFPANCPDADILSASFGSQFEDWWTRGIESLIEQDGLIVVAAIGNGSNVHDPLLYPGAGANAIGVGVIDSVSSDDLATTLSHLALAYPEHSSTGPSIDGRCKPDIVAPGNCLAAQVGEPNRYKPTGPWSSFATPIVAGTIGLLLQKARQDPNLSVAATTEGGNCVIKAVLMNSATKLPYWHKGQLAHNDDHTAPLDHIQGAGMLNAVGAYNQLAAGLNKPGKVACTGWDLNSLEKSIKPETIYEISLKDTANKVICATLVWNNHYNSTYPFQARTDLNANLRLELWGVDANNPQSAHLLDYSDSKTDNVEHIYYQADGKYTTYELVAAYSDDSNSTSVSERYALAWNISNPGSSDSFLLYDLYPDGVIDESDVMIFIDNWLNSFNGDTGYMLGDLNGDGAIGVGDLDILIKKLGLEADWHKK